MGIFDDFIRNEKLKPNLRVKKVESWGGLYPKGTGGYDPMPVGLVNKITRVPLKKK